MKQYISTKKGLREVNTHEYYPDYESNLKHKIFERDVQYFATDIPVGERVYNENEICDVIGYLHEDGTTGRNPYIYSKPTPFKTLKPVLPDLISREDVIKLIEDWNGYIQGKELLLNAIKAIK